MSIDRRTFLGGVAAAAVAAPAVAEVAVAAPKPAGWQPLHARFLPEVIETAVNIDLPAALPGTFVHVYNNGDKPISVYGAWAEHLEPKRGRAFLAISENTWVPLIV